MSHLHSFRVQLISSVIPPDHGQYRHQNLNRIYVDFLLVIYNIEIYYLNVCWLTLPHLHKYNKFCYEFLQLGKGIY